jgi:Domain of Unknown Function (DUF1080)
MKLSQITLLGIGLLSFALGSPGWAAEPDKDGFVPMFNGKDLAGWVNVNCHPKTFFVKDNEIITTGKPTGFLRTEKHYENFIMEFEWMHVEKTKMANSGLFVWGDPLPAVGTGYTRGIEVQVLCNFEVDWATSHGDIFSIWGAKCKPDRPHPKGYERCLPSERRCKGGGEWNHYRVEANNGVIKLQVNGKEVSGVSESNPRKGYLALESEGVECHFRNLKIKELAGTNPKPEEICDVAKEHINIFNGLDLEGWKIVGTSSKTALDAIPDGWRVSDGHLIQTKKKGEVAQSLECKKHVHDYEFIFDWKLAAKKDEGPVEVMLGNGKQPVILAILPGGKYELRHADKVVASAESKAAKPLGQYSRAVVKLDGDEVTLTVNKQAVLKAKVEGIHGGIGFPHNGTAVEFMNLFLSQN